MWQWQARCCEGRWWWWWCWGGGGARAPPLRTYSISVLAPDVNLARTACGKTPLMFAAGKGHLDIVRLLLQRGADRQLVSHRGKTARAYAKTHPLVQAALA